MIWKLEWGESKILELEILESKILESAVLEPEILKSDILKSEVKTPWSENLVPYLEHLENDLKNYDRIFLILGEDKRLLSFLNAFCDAIIVRNKSKILVLSVFHLENVEKYSLIYRKISIQEALDLYHLYHMYEFSNRFFILSPNKRVGGIFNYLDVGLLNLEEVFLALLDER